MIIASHLTRSLSFGIVFVGLAPLALAAENWPQWRGPDARGIGVDGEYPLKFSADDGYVWKIALPGLGCSTPAVWDDSIFVTCGIDGKDGVVCYGFDGKERWRQTLGPEREGKHRNGSGSNPSPATDGKTLVVYFKSGALAAFDLAGNELWRVDLQDRFGPDTLWWDLGTSPVLASDRVVVAVIQSGESYLAAFNLADGELLWRVPRQYECTVETDHAYTTPHVVTVDGEDQVVVWGADHLTGHSAATGEMLWECGGFNPQNEQNWRVIASPAIENGIAVVPYGRGEHVAGIRLGGKGDVTKTARIWERQGRNLGSDVPTPAVRDGRAYLLNDVGRITCLDVATGEEFWTSELPRNRNRYFSSPLLAGDKLYAAREDGILFVCRVSDDGCEVIAQNDMGESTIAVPVPVRGGLLVRGEESLFWIKPE